MTVIENDSPKEFFEGPFEVSDLIPFTFPYADRTDVKVKIGDEVATYGEEYEVSAESPSSILVKVNIDDGVQVTVYRETPIDQQSNYPQNSKFRSEQVESDFDRICMIQQEQKETLTRCLRMAIDTATAFDGLLPASSAGKALMWNSAGEIANTPFTMTEIENNVNAANAKSDTAVATATSAMATATSALSAATTAVATATSAEANSQTALAAATSAVATATTASVTATTALASATSAHSRIDSLATTIPTKTSDLTNDSGYITGIDYSAVTTALGYTPSSILAAGTGIDSTALGNGTIAVTTTIASKTDIGDGKAIFKKNGTAFKTITANQTATTTIDYTIPSVPTNVSAFTNDSGYITSTAIASMQTTGNLVTSVSSSSTNSQYPSAKLFYDTCGDIETLINNL